MFREQLGPRKEGPMYIGIGTLLLIILIILLIVFVF
jgi:hypothetical protein